VVANGPPEPTIVVYGFADSVAAPVAAQLRMLMSGDRDGAPVLDLSNIGDAIAT
jgi:hypothetical protein